MARIRRFCITISPQAVQHHRILAIIKRLPSSTIQELQILAQNVAQTENIYRKPDF